MTVDRDTIRARVRLFLESGHTYNEALYRAHLEPLGWRPQPQSPAHRTPSRDEIKECVARGIPIFGGKVAPGAER